MTKSDVATTLAYYGIPELNQYADQMIRGDIARNLHAASRGINSSLT